MIRILHILAKDGKLSLCRRAVAKEYINSDKIFLAYATDEIAVSSKIYLFPKFYFLVRHLSGIQKMGESYAYAAKTNLGEKID